MSARLSLLCALFYAQLDLLVCHTRLRYISSVLLFCTWYSGTYHLFVVLLHVIFFLLHTRLLSSFFLDKPWSQIGVVPSTPRFLPSIFIAHRVQQSHCSSIFHRVLPTHVLALFPQVNLSCTRKNTHEFIRACTRGDSNSRKLTYIITGSRLT